MTALPLLLPLLLSDSNPKSVDRPNVIVILADDLGWNDLGCMGSDYYETPNIDRLAHMGVKFTNGYSACSVSSPSRASIMTGKSPINHGITTWIGDKYGEDWSKSGKATKLLPPAYKHSLDTTEITIAKALKAEGYSTFFAGKWHLGGDGSSPEEHGFDLNKGGRQVGSPSGGYFSPYKNPKLTDGENGENLSMRLAQETVDYIKNGHHGKPFFAFLSFYAVHGPIQTTKERWQYFRDKAARRGIAEHGFAIDRTQPVRLEQDNPVYAGLIAQMDDAVGLLLDNIIELGLDKNSMIIFTSDNGGVVSGDNYSTSLAPLRGGKGRQWEGGTRVPYIISYPDCKANTISDVPIIGMDIFPTILEYTNSRLIPNQHKDGMSILTAMKRGKTIGRDLFWYFPHYGNQGGEPSAYIRSGDWKLIYYFEDERSELYNIKRDLSESIILNDKYPEKVKELRAKILTLIENASKPIENPNYTTEDWDNKMRYNKTTLLENVEATRQQMLSPNWEPNSDWWGSRK